MTVEMIHRPRYKGANRRARNKMSYESPDSTFLDVCQRYMDDRAGWNLYWVEKAEDYIKENMDEDFLRGITSSEINLLPAAFDSHKHADRVGLLIAALHRLIDEKDIVYETGSDRWLPRIGENFPAGKKMMMFSGTNVAYNNEGIIIDYSPTYWSRRMGGTVVEYKDGDKWRVLIEGKQIGGMKTIDFKPVKARHVRLNIIKANEVPTLEEFRVLAPVGK